MSDDQYFGTAGRDSLLAEKAQLEAANEAATSWGAAVGARHERIKAIERLLGIEPRGHDGLTQTERMAKFKADARTSRPRPTIGQTWTDPATGQEVIVVPVEATAGMEVAGAMANYRFDESVAASVYTAMLASLRAKEGK